MPTILLAGSDQEQAQLAQAAPTSVGRTLLSDDFEFDFDLL
jgi:hypothetical protein